MFTRIARAGLLPAALSLLLVPPGCVAGRGAVSDTEVARVERSLGVDAPDPRVAERALTAAAVTADDVIAAVVAASPELAEARARARAELAEVAADGARPPPELELEIWGAPLERPWALGDAEMLMVGLRQSLDARGRRDALARAALGDAEVAAAEVAATELALVGRARVAHAAWHLASRQVALHDEHGGVVAAMVDAVAAAYRAGRAAFGETARIEMMVVAIHQDRIDAEQRLASARAMINALAGRAPDAPLGAPAAPAPRLDALALDDPGVASLVAQQGRARAELASAAAAIARADATRAAVAAQAWPEVMVGGRYMYMAAHDAHAWGAMVSFTLPWLDGRRGPDAEAARHRLAAEQAAGDATRAAVQYELADAAARLRGARARLAGLRDELLPRAEQLYDATRVAFAGGRGGADPVLSALDAWLALRLRVEGAIADVVIAEAELERAVGAPLAPAPATATTGGGR